MWQHWLEPYENLQTPIIIKKRIDGKKIKMDMTSESFEEFGEKVRQLAFELRANVCPIWQCGGELEHIEDRTNWQEPDLKCKNCGALFEFKGYKKICDCGDHTENKNGVCETCELFVENEKK